MKSYTLPITTHEYEEPGAAVTALYGVMEVLSGISAQISAESSVNDPTDIGRICALDGCANTAFSVAEYIRGTMGESEG